MCVWVRDACVGFGKCLCVCGSVTRVWGLESVCV